MEIYEEIRADRELGARRLVAEYRPRLEAAARMLCQDAHEAEDLVFRAFERAIERIDDFRPTGSFYYWVYTILLNIHRMDLRRRAARKEACFRYWELGLTKEAVRNASNGRPRHEDVFDYYRRELAEIGVKTSEEFTTLLVRRQKRLSQSAR